MNVCEAIFQRADPAAVALVWEAQSWSYGELARVVEGLAEQLRGTGWVRPGWRVGLWCGDAVAHIALALAVLKVGGCVVPVAPELAERERAALAEITGLQAMVTGRSERWRGAVSGEVALQVGPVSARVAGCVRVGEVGFDEGALASLNPAFVRFSSGTTGSSKGVVLSHETLLERITAANAGLQIGASDRIIWILPMAHHFAVSIVLYLWHGATTVLTRSHLAEEVLTVARREGATVLYAAPFHHRLLAAEGSGLPWPSLRLAVSTACRLPVETAVGFRERYGVGLSQALGIIEVGLPCLNVRAADSKPESVGRAQPAFALQVRDEAGRPVKAGEAGELFIQGPGLLDAYLWPWQTREGILEAGWFATGDLACLDGEGELFLLGRVRSVINVGGMKCFPEEVEEVLNAFDGVVESRVLGRAHAEVGAVPVAELVMAPGLPLPPPQALMAHCRQQLARFKVPVEYRLVTGVPRTASGKIKRC